MANKNRKDKDNKRIQSDETRQAVSEKTPRRKRIPLDGRERNILTVKGKDNKYHYCFVNDSKNNIAAYLDAGYEFVSHAVEIGDTKVEVTKTEDGRVSKPVGFDRDLQKPLIAYLMRIRKDWYEEDMAAYNQTVDETELGMKRNLNSTEDGRYHPQHEYGKGVQIRR